MQKRKIVVGLNTGHDGGAAIIIDGKLSHAISEERLNRRRYSSGYLNSFFYCLQATKTNINDISKIVFSSYGKNLPKGYMGDLKPLGLSPKIFSNVDHHLSHAYSTYFLSPFDDSLIIVLDGEGNNNMTETYYIGEGQKIKRIGGNNLKRKSSKGIGRTYEAFTNFLGWTDQDAGKTMGLAPFGNVNEFKTELYKISATEIEGYLETKYEQGALNYIDKNNLEFGPLYNNGESKGSKDAAAYVQFHTEKIVIELVKRLVAQTGKRKLCIAGGVGLNSSINSKLILNKIVDDIFILPASSDRGQPIGNALYGYQQITKKIPRTVLKTDYLGRSYSENEILSALRRESKANVTKIIPRKDLYYKKYKNIAKITARLISEGKIIGWFQGGSEFGPRALGHRSILCDPRDPSMKDILNNRVKHRETFRPFAPSCLQEYAYKYFDFPIPTPFMLFVVPVKTVSQNIIPSVVHVDGTGRLQTVTKKENGIFYELISEFHKITGVPVLLNTSFNDNEPIVETPADAVSTFLKTNIDYLSIGNYLVWKK